MTAIHPAHPLDHGRSAPTPSRQPGRLTLWLLGAVFILPFALGTGLYWSGWRPTRFVNHGELLQPARALPEHGLRTLDGQPLPTAALRGQWLLLRVASRSCDAACGTDLRQMLQLHRALGKEQPRVRRALIVTGPAEAAATPAWDALRAAFPDLLVARADGTAEASAWRHALAGNEDALYLVDPFGHVMMRYADPPDLRGALKDLERLLKYTWVR